jgi:hypothetical protein
MLAGACALRVTVTQRSGSAASSIVTAAATASVVDVELRLTEGLSAFDRCSYVALEAEYPDASLPLATAGVSTDEAARTEVGRNVLPKCY